MEELAAVKRLKKLIKDKRGNAAVMFFGFFFCLSAFVLVVMEIGGLYNKYEYCEDVAKNCLLSAMQSVLTDASTEDAAYSTGDKADGYLADGALNIKSTQDLSKIEARVKEYLNTDLANYKYKFLSLTTSQTYNEATNTHNAGSTSLGGINASAIGAEDKAMTELKLIIYIPTMLIKGEEDPTSGSRGYPLYEHTIPKLLTVKVYGYYGD